MRRMFPAEVLFSFCSVFNGSLFVKNKVSCSLVFCLFFRCQCMHMIELQQSTCTPIFFYVYMLYSFMRAKVKSNNRAKF